MSDNTPASREQIQEDLEFAEEWFGAAQEGEVICEDEIELVKDLTAHIRTLQAQLDAKDTEIAKKDEFFREWASGEGKFQEFGGWDRIERLQDDHKALMECMQELVISAIMDPEYRIRMANVLQSLKEPNT